MRVDAEKDGVARLSQGDNDDRVTPIGKVVRRYRLDEIPQLLNIFKGDMSVVGPRPERPEIAEIYYEKMPEFKLRLQVKAGLTGYAQIYGKYNTAPYEKLEFDLLLYNHPYCVIFSAMIFVFLAVSLNKRKNLLLALLYCAVIGYMTLLFRENISERNNLAVLWAFRHFLVDNEVRLGILKNIWLFIPLGAILSRIRQKKGMILISIALSIVIETIQHFTKIGYYELDDIISNSIGGAIGYFMGILMSNLRNTLFQRNQKSARRKTVLAHTLE